MKPREETFITLDLKQWGLGNGSCGHTGTLPPYLVLPGRYGFDYVLRAFKSRRHKPERLGREYIQPAL